MSENGQDVYKAGPSGSVSVCAEPRFVDVLGSALAGFGVAEPVPNLCRTPVEHRCRTTPYIPPGVRRPFGTGLRLNWAGPTLLEKHAPRLVDFLSKSFKRHFAEREEHDPRPKRCLSRAPRASRPGRIGSGPSMAQGARQRGARGARYHVAVGQGSPRRQARCTGLFGALPRVSVFRTCHAPRDPGGWKAKRPPREGRPSRVLGTGV